VEVGARAAGPGDLGDLARLAGEALAAIASQRGGSLLATSASSPPTAGEEVDGESLEVTLRRALGEGDRSLWTGTIDGVVVGFAVGRTVRSPAGPSLGSVEAFFVEPEARGVGVGRAMVDAALGWFAERGCHGVDALALPGDRRTKSFFEAAGFKARLLVMHRETS
jgi:GNAT superfamily N-acetyltransferase